MLDISGSGSVLPYLVVQWKGYFHYNVTIPHFHVTCQPPNYLLLGKAEK
jgi:hypothetical protein